MTADEIRRAVLGLPMAARHSLVEALDADLKLDERMIDQAAWLTFRLTAAASKRNERTRI